jgi:hypothetical protein
MRVDSGSRSDPRLRVTVKRVEQRVAVGIVVWRQPSLYIGQGNVTPDANIRPLAYVREIQIQGGCFSDSRSLRDTRSGQFV